MKTFSKLFLRFAEWVFLRAHGWTPIKGYLGHLETWWKPPKDYNTKKGNEPHNHGHALNSQKYMNSMTKKYGVLFSDGDSR